MNKKFVRISIIFLGVAFMLLVFMFGIDRYVKFVGDNRIETDIENLPRTQVALVLGAKVYETGQLSEALRNRVETALLLYQEEKVDRFLLSGDHGRDNYDEVNAMKEYLLEKGVPAEDIFMDHAGFETYDSVYRAKEIFEIESMTIVTQEFHLPRALYIAKSLDIEASGVIAPDWYDVPLTQLELREMAARDKAFFYILINKKPKFLGEKIPITGDSKKSWD